MKRTQSLIRIVYQSWKNAGRYARSASDTRVTSSNYIIYYCVIKFSEKDLAGSILCNTRGYILPSFLLLLILSRPIASYRCLRLSTDQRAMSYGGATVIFQSFTRRFWPTKKKCNNSTTTIVSKIGKIRTSLSGRSIRSFRFYFSGDGRAAVLLFFRDVFTRTWFCNIITLSVVQARYLKWQRERHVSHGGAASAAVWISSTFVFLFFSFLFVIQAETEILFDNWGRLVRSETVKVYHITTSPQIQVIKNKKTKNYIIQSRKKIKKSKYVFYTE